MLKPSKVDLRSNIDVTYNQGSTNSCMGQSLRNETEVRADNIYKLISKRFSASYAYYYGRYWKNNGIFDGLDNGVSLDGYIKSVNNHGICESHLYDTNIHSSPNDAAQVNGIQYSSNIGEIRYCEPTVSESVKRYLANGIPVLMAMPIHDGFGGLTGVWTEHDWNTDVSIPVTMSHYVVIVGYDDAYNRFLAENSYGNQWGDGGFFGIPYEKFDNPWKRVFQNLFARYGFRALPNITQFGTVNDVPSLEFMDYNKVYNDLTRENIKINDNTYTSFIKEELLNFNSIPELLDSMREWNISDLIVEIVMKWKRGFIHEFYLNNRRGYNWKDIRFKQINYNGIQQSPFTNETKTFVLEYLEAVKRKYTALNLTTPQAIVDFLSFYYCNDVCVEYLMQFPRGTVFKLVDSNNLQVPNSFWTQF